MHWGENILRLLNYTKDKEKKGASPFFSFGVLNFLCTIIREDIG